MIKWTKRQHPGYTDLCPGLLNKDQWITTEGKFFSIIPPCIASQSLFELYDGSEIYRFDTLEEAKSKAEELNNPDQNGLPR